VLDAALSGISGAGNAAPASAKCSSSSASPRRSATPAHVIKAGVAQKIAGSLRTTIRSAWPPTAKALGNTYKHHQGSDAPPRSSARASGSMAQTSMKCGDHGGRRRCLPKAGAWRRASSKRASPHGALLRHPRPPPAMPRRWTTFNPMARRPISTTYNFPPIPFGRKTGRCAPGRRGSRPTAPSRAGPDSRASRQGAASLT